MLSFQGKSVLGGVAVGKICVYQKSEQTVKRIKITDVEGEMERFTNAKLLATEQLKKLYETSVQKIGEQEAAIFEIHQMMLEDPDYIESVENIIRSQEVNAEFAVAGTADNFAAMFEAMDDEYMQGRAADVRDISERIIGILTGTGSAGIASDEPVIIVASDLAPSETVQLEKDKVLAFVTIQGSVNSHTAILAKNMNIPALVQTNITLDELDGKMGIVDGFNGKFYVEPDEETMQAMTKRMEEEKEKQELLLSLKGKPNVTLDGQKINLYANIGSLKDVAMVLANDAGGIGLFRSEFLYLEKDYFPTEEEQFQVYKTVAETMAGKKVIIRTLDLGADKQAGYFDLGTEENPALGYRAIRICLTRTEIFKTQLRALFRASMYGNISIMYPMIISVDEVRRIKTIVDEVKKELTEQGISYKDVEQGIMIETPAAVLISDELAKEVDFFSVGTNDLTQYTLAIDRQNEKLDEFYNPHHPAILKMLKIVVDNAHAAGIWAGICGELGADLSLTQTFLKMGFDELSVSPGKILPIRKVVLETDVRKL